MAEQCFTCSAMAHGISVAKLHRQSLRLLTLAQAVRKRRVQRAAAVFSHAWNSCSRFFVFFAFKCLPKTACFEVSDGLLCSQKLIGRLPRKAFAG